MPDQPYVLIDPLYDGSELVEVQASGDYGDRRVTVKDKTSGNVTDLDLNDAWYLADMLSQAVTTAARRPLTAEEEAHYTGPCPPWCVVKDHARVGSAYAEFHFQRIGERIRTSAMPFTTWGPPDDEATFAEVEVLQHVLEDPEPLVAIGIDAFDSEPVRFTADEAEQVARRMLEAVAVIREADARKRAAGRVLALAGR
jgi:hypothetical protein